jgi:phosphoribulokinase
MHLKLTRDSDGRPVDSLHVHGYAPREDAHLLKKAIWSGLGTAREVPPVLGDLGDGKRSDPLAVTQLLLLHHLIESRPAR